LRSTWSGSKRELAAVIRASVPPHHTRRAK
jgi:hypothetical protein